MSGFGSFPPYFLRLREVNRRGPALASELATPGPLDPLDVQDAVSRGAWLVDARPIHEWAVCHPVGAVSIELRPAFASWLGWVVPFGAPVVLLVDEAGMDEAVRQARDIGYDAVLGWVSGGMPAWERAGLPVATAEEVGPDEARRRMEHGVTLVDVRQSAEHTMVRVPGAVHVELGEIIDGRTPPLTECVTFCGHGERSATAASLLERAGVKVANLVGGTQAWEAAGFPLKR